MTLANERTFLAWIRTALGAAAASIAVTQLLDSGNAILRLVLALVLAAGAFAAAVWGALHWRAVERAIRAGEEIPSAATWPAAALLATVAIGAAALAVFNH